MIDCITAEATALINCTWWGCIIPSPPSPPTQWYFSGIIGTSQSLSAHLNPRLHSSVSIGVSIFHSVLETSISVCAYPLGCALLNLLLNLDYECLYLIPDSLPPSPVGAARHRWAPQLDMHSLIPVSAPWSGFAPLKSILHSSITISTPLAHHIRHSSYPGGAPLFPSKFIILHFKLHFDSPRANLNSNLLDITNTAR